jgi:hypothetical protein
VELPGRPWLDNIVDCPSEFVPYDSPSFLFSRFRLDLKLICELRIELAAPSLRQLDPEPRLGLTDTPPHYHNRMTCCRINLETSAAPREARSVHTTPNFACVDEAKSPHLCLYMQRSPDPGEISHARPKLDQKRLPTLSTQ